jgi:hypothetical protein
MNTIELEELAWSERELEELVTAFVRAFHRLPSRADLEQYRALLEYRAVLD